MDELQKSGSIYLGFDISKLKLIGQGRQGKVYMLDGNKVIKIFYNNSSCESQLNILLKGKDSPFFPKVFESSDYCIVMSFIEGSSLNNYLYDNTLDKQLSMEIVKLIKEFKRLNFIRLDIRLPHIFVQADKTIKIIDPRGSFRILQPYPLLLLRGLQEQGVLELFLKNIKTDYPEYYSFWKDKV